MPNMQNGSGIGPSAGAGSAGSRRALAQYNLVLCALEILAVLGIKTLELHIRLGHSRCFFAVCSTKSMQ
jgi:hypothetical protein